MEENNIRLKDVDEGLSFKILEKWDMAFNLYVERKWVLCYRALKGLYYMINMYQFDGKEDLDNLINGIDAHLTALEGTQTVTEDEMIKVGEVQYEFGELVNEFFKRIPSAFSSLGKWLKVLKNTDDRDEQFSKETFGTNVKLLDEKKEELKTLTNEEIIKLCSPNIIHFLHSRTLIKKAK